MKRFYIDEPNSWHRNFGYEFVAQVDAQVPVDGKLYVSEYHHESCAWGEHGGAMHNAIEHFISDYAPRVSTKTKFGTHSKWEIADFPWGTGTVTDPRYQWTQLKNALASEGKFEFGWVPSLKNHYFGDFPRVVQWNKDQATIEDMKLIWGHAANEGANTVFIFVENTTGQFGSGILDNQLFAAYQAAAGWVEREEEKVQDVFCCTTQTYDPDTCEFYERIHLGEFRWTGF